MVVVRGGGLIKEARSGGNSIREKLSSHLVPLLVLLFVFLVLLVLFPLLLIVLPYPFVGRSRGGAGATIVLYKNYPFFLFLAYTSLTNYLEDGRNIILSARLGRR